MATDVYFGICPNVPADFKTGSPTITITSGVATFSTAQTGDLVGIGTVIDYDIDNKIAYISGKINTSIWSVVNGDGTTPSNVTGVTVNSISHPFTSFSSALAGISAIIGGKNLVTLDLQLHIVGYCRQDSYDFDNTRSTISYTADSTHRLKFYTPENTSTQCNFDHRPKNNGTWDDTKYRMIPPNILNNPIGLIQFNESADSITMFFDCEGIQGSMQNYWSEYSARFIHGSGLPNSTFNVSCCTARFIRGTHKPGEAERAFWGWRGAGGQTLTNSVHNVFNNVAYIDEPLLDFRGFACQIEIPNTFTANIYENTFINFRGPCQSFNSPNTNIWNVKNNVFLYTAAAKFRIFYGTWSNNIWRDADTGDSNDIQTSQTDAQLFTSATGSEETWNYTPKEGSDLLDKGERLTGLTPDMSGDLDNPPGVRPFGAGWDVGALESQVPGDILPIIYRRRGVVSSGF